MSEVMWSCHLLLERIIAKVLTPAKTGGKEGIAQQEGDSQERVTENIQQKKGLVDRRQSGEYKTFSMSEGHSDDRNV